MPPPREPVRQSDQTYFVSFQTAARRPLFRHERWATSLLETLGKYMDQLDLHDFAIMPDHVHLLLTPHCPIERAVQLIKGGYSFKARREFNWSAEIWQPGFSDHRIRTQEDLNQHIAYIAKNIASFHTPNYRYCGAARVLPLKPFPLWLKPPISCSDFGGAEAPPLQST